jgi:hypothetical protein
MPGEKFIQNSGGDLVEKVSIQASVGAGDAGKLVSTDTNGRFDLSLMPSGFGAETQSIICSEALAAGDYVNIYNNTGTPNCRKADATASAKRCHGYVLTGYTSGQSALVYTDGKNNQNTALTAGDVYLSASTPGKATNTAPSAATQIVQKLGVAVSATEVNFDPLAVIVLA